MSILQKLKARDPRAGYAHDFVGVIKRGARDIVERGVKVVTNAGGMNPVGCKMLWLPCCRRRATAEE